MKTPKIVLFVLVADGLLSIASAAVRIRPEGHLKEFLSRQVTGLTGQYTKMGYPFDGCLWTGVVTNNFVEEDLAYSRRIPTPQEDVWWPYEQSAYLLDGMMRLSRLVEAPQLRFEFKRNLDWCIDHAGPDGDLFAAYLQSTCQWPLVVFFRAALAYVEETDDTRVKNAFIRHYSLKKNGFHHTYDRNVLNVEGFLKVAEWTGDRSFVDVAEQWFLSHAYYRQFSTTDRVHSHGVTFAEMLKVPMLLYKATGKESWRALAVKALRDVFRHNETPSGQVSCNEYLSGRDPWEGSETCVVSDMLCSLAHFLDDPEVGCEAADRMERIAYNALPGAVTKDFTALQYNSFPNQAVATPFSHDAHFSYAEPDWSRYRVNHCTPCCAGNVNRAMPLFVERMWKGDKVKGRGQGQEWNVSSLLLGPSRFVGDGYEIVCETDYPFGDKLVYRFKTSSTGSDALGLGRVRTFSFRVPSWVASATVSKNGTPLDLAVCPGTLARIEDTWNDGDTLEVALDQPVTFHSDRHWHWLRRGALTLAHPVKTRCVRERPDDRFSDLTLDEPGPFNFAFDLDHLSLSSGKSNNQTIQTIKQFSPYPFETPNLVVKVTMDEIREWQTLAEGRFTPHVPLCTHPTGRQVTVDFVPYATTLTRVTAFPDTVKRTPLPVVRAYVSRKCFAYDPAKPLARQQAESEAWDDVTFMDRADTVQRSPDLWCDLEAHFHAIDNRMAYVLFRFWSDREGPVTCALGASRCVQAFFDGKEVYANGPIVEGRLLAPFWFDVNAKKGYNFLKVKVACGAAQETVFGHDQYRREWGAKLDVFRVEK